MIRIGLIQFFVVVVVVVVVVFAAVVVVALTAFIHMIAYAV